MVDKEGKYKVNAWWLTLSNWAAALRSKEGERWEDIQKLSHVSSGEKAPTPLLPTPVMQLKKCHGGGIDNADSYFKFAQNGRDFIIGQLNIYKPQYLISIISGLNTARLVWFAEGVMSPTTPDWKC